MRLTDRHSVCAAIGPQEIKEPTPGIFGPRRQRQQLRSRPNASFDVNSQCPPGVARGFLIRAISDPLNTNKPQAVAEVSLVDSLLVGLPPLPGKMAPLHSEFQGT